MDRRSFLVGAGSILTSAYVDKANWFLRNKNSVVPFNEVGEPAGTLYFVDMVSSPQIMYHFLIEFLELAVSCLGLGEVECDCTALAMH